MKITKRQLRRIIREAVGSSDIDALAREIMDYYETIKDDESIYTAFTLGVHQLIVRFKDNTKRDLRGVDTSFGGELHIAIEKLNDGKSYFSSPEYEARQAAQSSTPRQEPDEDLEMIVAQDDFYNMIMDTEQPSQAWEDGVRTVADFRKYIPSFIDAARRGGLSKREINSITSKAWKTETSARRPARRRSRNYSFLD